QPEAGRDLLAAGSFGGGFQRRFELGDLALSAAFSAGGYGCGSLDLRVWQPSIGLAYRRVYWGVVLCVRPRHGGLGMPGHHRARRANTDAALLAAIVAAQGALGLVYRAVRDGRRVPPSLPLMFWLAEAVAILLKGPPGPVLALLTGLSLSIADRDRRWVEQLR